MSGERVDRLRANHQTRTLLTLRRSFGKWRDENGERERESLS